MRNSLLRDCDRELLIILGEIRQQRGLSTTQLFSAMQVSPVEGEAILAGRQRVRFQDLHALSQKLDIPPQTFFRSGIKPTSPTSIEPEPATLAELVRKYRRVRGYTQHELGVQVGREILRQREAAGLPPVEGEEDEYKAGLSRPSISRLEAGISFVQPKYIPGLAAALKIDPALIVERMADNG